MTVKTSTVQQGAMAKQVESELSMAQGPARITAFAAPQPAADCGAVTSSSGKPSEQESGALRPDITQLSSAALQGLRQAAQTQQSAIRPDSSAATASDQSPLGPLLGLMVRCNTLLSSQQCQQSGLL